ncbi:polysaccharide pyruvyl transferase family protein [bacterium]|nr:polysaccharide pyruvyl transferase family protein [bacterium]
MEIKYRHNTSIIQIDPAKNWGDIISHLVLKYFSQSKKLQPKDVFYFDEYGYQIRKNGKILSIGSSMLFTQPDDIVWGTGCIDYGQIGKIPKKIYAVRGPLTQNELSKQGIECPEVYGDPALLFPEIYNPEKTIKYEYGLIPHYIDYTDENSLKIIHNLSSQGVKIINITSGIFHFIDELIQCKNIMSSSLHGLIAADAYNIPNIRVKLSDKLVGGDFKFKDYSLSVNKPFNIGDINNFTNLEYFCNISWDKEALLNAGPWNDFKCKFF